ncbi:MAG: efflux RND transporter permease subunit [Acidobacteria bacterium]|nr:efflux RND transporter permease subunit [Acidobacteriota bacterium]
MKLAEVCVKRPVFATMLVMTFVVLGVFSYTRLGVDLFPKIDLPTVTVRTVIPGASPEEVESQITKPIEEVINTISGIDELRSTTLEGVSIVVVQFSLDKNGDVAAQEVRDKVATVIGQLPRDTDPPIIERVDFDAAPVLSISVYGDRPLRELTEIADKQIKQRLESVQGIGSIQIVGGRQREIQISLDADKLQAYRLSIDQVRNAVRAQNVEIPGGRIDQGPNELVLRTLGRIDQVRDFERMVVGNAGSAPIYLGGIAKVEDGTEEPRSLARQDGNPAVSLLVRKQSGTNTVQVADTIKEELDLLRAQLPPDVHADVIRDQSRFIKASVHAINEHLVVGSLLAAIVVLLFMRNFRSTLISAVAVPISIIATFTAMAGLDMTLNNLTMLGLTLAVGIVIDDAIVVLENIYRYIEEEGYPPIRAAIAATEEIGLAVMATTLSLVVIFLPVAFLGGIPGRFLKSFGLTMAVSILVSMLVSFTLTPMLSSRFLKKSASGHKSKDSGFYRVIDRAYGYMLHWALRHRLAMVAVFAFTVVMTIPMAMLVGKDFFAYDDQSEFEIIVKTPDGTSLAGTDSVLQSIEKEAWNLRGVRHVLSTINAGGSSGVTDGGVYIRLVDLEERDYSQFEVMDDARRMVKERFPGLRAAVQPVQGVSGGNFRAQAIVLNVRGPDLKQLEQYSTQILQMMRSVPGMVDQDTTLNIGNPEVHVRLDRAKAADLGVRATDVASALRTMVAGEEVSKFKDGDEQYSVRLRVQREDRDRPDRIENLWIPSNKLGQVQLANFASLHRNLGPANIERMGRERQVTLVANLESNVGIGDGVAALNEKLATLDLKPGYRTEWTGRAKTLAELQQSFVTAFLFSAIFMYMVLAAQFESFLHPITIMLSLPLSIPFALFSLWITGSRLDLFSGLGILLLFGIVKKNSILQIDYTNTLRARGMERHDALIKANHARLRPILMTTLAIVAGMLPIVLSTGPGSGSRAPIGIVVMGGQMLCLLLTLLFTPVAYSLFDDLVARFRTARVYPDAAEPMKAD